MSQAPQTSGRAQRTPVSESGDLGHNRLGGIYSIKLVYPGFFLGMKAGEVETSVGFPAQKERLAKWITAGHLFFVYVTSPERRVIGLAQAKGPVEFAPEKDFKRPWQLALSWVLGPRYPGVQFSDIGLQVRARVGDSVYAITDEIAAAFIERLQDLPDLDGATLEILKARYQMFA